jgi:hypothetical protein
VLSPFAKGSGYSNALHYTHSSTLRTLEELFGLTPLLGDAANVNTSDLSDLFQAPYTVSGTVMACAPGPAPTCTTSTPFPGATLQLVDSSGTPVTTITSGSSGNYAFTGLAAGNYTVNISGTINSVSYASSDPLDVTGYATGVLLDAYPM